ncbi:odorant receptor 33b-like [Mycetomoellerius zeteki]|uniref:odorant receptor 33b-like n=1 Tax=Mycetomoellerius zeteki TaxID=64791 RepID=UPI00084E8C85|nr:PREDICTED: odorant receptor 33b-like [Trachymyrmex zeteki]
MLESRQHLTVLYMAYIICIVINIFGHMCMYCAVGEILTAQCDRIHYAIYFNEWYTLNARNTRDLVLLMLKTNKSLHLNFGKMFPLTMATFCSLLKTSAGYISILLATKNQSNF